MKWHSNKLTLFAKKCPPFFCLSVLVLSLAPLTSYSLDEKRLWLAKSHQIHYLALLKSALAAESIDRCVEVLEGTLDRDQSKEDHPIFRILCRQDNGRSYNEMVDGLSFETLTTPKPVEVELTPEELERIRLAEEERQRQIAAQRKLSMWQMCELALLDRTKMMIDLVWLHNGQPEPTEFTDEGAHFEVGFNAKSIWGKPLAYTADCAVTDEAVTHVEIGKAKK